MTDYICALFYRIKAELSKKTGQGMVEYALILAAVAVIAVAVIGTSGGTDGTATGLTGAIQSAFTKAKTKIEAVNP